MSQRKITVIVVTSIIIVFAVVFFLTRKPQLYQQQLFVMDTQATVSIYGQQDLSEYTALLKSLDSQLDCYEEGSSFYILNSIGSCEVNDVQLSILNQSKELFEKYGYVDCTSGAIIDLWNVTSDNPQIPTNKQISNALSTVGFDKLSISDSIITAENGTKVNFGASAKGFALDEVYSLLESKNEDCAIISFGSSTLCYGQKPDGTSFTVAITNPEDDSQNCLSFETSQAFVSTSGGYERFFQIDGVKYSHIFDLETGKPCETDLASVTVICQNGMESDFLSTAIFIEGTKGLSKHLSSNDYFVIAIDTSGGIYCSKSLRGSIEIMNDNFSFKEG